MKKLTKRQFVDIPDKILIFEHFEYENVIRIEYLKEKQDSHHCIILSLSGTYATPKDYRIRFMDTQGNPLDEEIERDLNYIRADIGYNYKGIVSLHSLELLSTNFYEKMMDVMVSTALKRKTELIDFFDPQVWQASNNPDVIGLDKMEYLRRVQGFRSKEENMILEFIQENPGTSYEEALTKLNLVHYESRYPWVIE